MISVIYQVLQDEYAGDVVAFMFDFVVESNLALIMGFAVTITLLVHLEWLLKPYNEQDKHQGLMDRITLILRFEAANKNKDANQYAATMVLLNDLKEQMVRIKANPKLLGVFTLSKS